MFKFFLIFFLLLIFVPTVRRFLFALLVGNSMLKEQKKANEQYAQQVKKEGDINIKHKTDKTNDFKGGEYIDYEEVK